jgi:hypothetical protein
MRKLRIKFRKTANPISTRNLLSAMLITLAILCLCIGLLQYRPASAQSEQELAYNNPKLGISFNYPSFLVARESSDGVVLSPASQENGPKSPMIFVAPFPSQYSHLSPAQYVEQVWHVQVTGEADQNGDPNAGQSSIHWVQYKTNNGMKGMVGFASYGGAIYQFAMMTDPMHVDRSKAIFNTITKSMSLGQASSATMQKERNAQNEINSDKFRTEMGIINHIGG